MENEEEPTTPFWAESSVPRRGPSPSLFLNSGLLLFILCISLSLFIYFIVPTFISLRPNMLKKSWDSLNITLVLLALIFGFLSRNINYDDRNDKVIKSDESTPRGWYEYSDRTDAGGLRRSYSSYPNLREIDDTGDRWRFYDDMSLARVPCDPPVRPVVKTGTKDTGDRWRFDDDTSLANRTDEASRDPPARPLVNSGHTRCRSYDGASFAPRANEASHDPLDGPVVDTGDKWRSYDDTSLSARADEIPRVSPVRSVVNNGKVRIDDSGNDSRRFVEGEYVDHEPNTNRVSVLAIEKIIEQVGEEKQSLQTPHVRRMTPWTADTTYTKEETSKQTTYRLDSNRYESSPPRRSERKRGGNATKHFIDSFRKKKKNQRQKSVESFNALLGSHPPPEPPPPLPRNFFSSKKSKKFITDPPPPPPPPPFFRAQAQRSTAVVAQTRANTVLHRPVVSMQNGGGRDSPLRQIPPPPPLPPFKIKSWKFVVKGDYVSIGSMSSGDDVDSPTSSESGETPTGAMFCPSPDVNSKADMFIAKFRAGLKLQKMNSMNQKQGLGLSNLGPSMKPN